MYFAANNARQGRMSVRNLGQVMLQSRFVRDLSKLMSSLLEETISPLQALKILHTEIAFLCLLLFSSHSLTAAAALASWSLAALLDCKGRYAKSTEQLHIF